MAKLVKIYLFKDSIDGNRAKRRISKRVFQGSKAHQNFRKTNISYPLIRTRYITCSLALQEHQTQQFQFNFELPLT